MEKIIHGDCMEYIRGMEDDSVDLTLTDIPYGEVNRESNGLRNLDKEYADIVTFDLEELVHQLCRVTKGSIYMFCGTEQVSTIRRVMVEEGLATRHCIWEKCLDERTKILVKTDGKVRFIFAKDITNEMQVHNGSEWVQVTSVYCMETDSYMELELKNGGFIRCTENHRFLSGGELKQAKDLCEGDLLDTRNTPMQTERNGEAVIAKVKSVKSRENRRFYDISIDSDDHLFCLHDGIVTHNSNPSPMNGKSIWLSAIENIIFGKKKGAVFNEYCKSSVFKHPVGSSKIHPTEKPIGLIKKLIAASSSRGETVFDPFLGSGTTALAAHDLGRHCIGIELNEDYYDIAKKRIEEGTAQISLFDV